MESIPRTKHALIVPYPTPGHINPLLHLAKVLHSHGFHITFAVTEYIHGRLLCAGLPPQLRLHEGFHLVVVPDGLPLSGRDGGLQYLRSLPVAMSTTFVSALRERVAELSCDPALPPISCVVAGLIGPALKLAEEMNVPGFLFWTTSACGFFSPLYTRELIHRGYLAPEDKSSVDLDEVIDWIPGMKPVRLGDMTSIYDAAIDREDTFLKFYVEAEVWASRASGVILNTFYGLEGEAMDAIKLKCKKLYAIGSISEVANSCAVGSSLHSLQLSVWKEDRGCLAWLDKQAAGSVIYVNFGSLAVLDAQQLVELAWGIAGSKVPFLWIIRHNILSGESVSLPEDFLRETESRGLLTDWCPQEEVLQHPAIGGFLTHAGWNSILESVRNGVPMLCCPFLFDQRINCRYATEEWSMALGIDGAARREKIEALVRDLMVGHKAKDLKDRLNEWRESLLEHIKEGGSSFQDLEALISDSCLQNP